MTKEKSKTLICQDDSLSIYQAFDKGLLCAAACYNDLALFFIICILTHKNDTVMIKNNCEDTTLQQKLVFDWVCIQKVGWPYVAGLVQTHDLALYSEMTSKTVSELVLSWSIVWISCRHERAIAFNGHDSVWPSLCCKWCKIYASSLLCKHRGACF